MPTTRLSEAQWKLLLEAFRLKPGNAEHAARHAGVDPRTAKRAWQGPPWDNPPWATRSAQEVLDDEKMEVRVQVRLKEQADAQRGAAEREKVAEATQDALAERGRELQAARSTLSAAITTLAILGQLAEPTLMIAKRAAQVLRGQADSMTFDQAKEVLKLYAEVAREASLVAKRSIEIGRLLVGHPHKVTGHRLAPRGLVVDGPGVRVPSSAETSVAVDRALEALKTPARVKQATEDLFRGNFTDDVLLLVESQGFSDTQVH